jgi:outer membrane biosynthesis protein TonB
MSDDLDDLIRRAMKSLDSQVPSGYFESLTERTLGRLEKDMQTTEGEGSDVTGALPPREEDSGLHDIRSLATSQRMQLKRTSQNPITTDDDELASSSAGWKAIALPEPAKIVSLPELSERASKKHLDFEAPRSIDQAPVTPITAAPAQRKKKSGGKIVLAMVGMGLAAAAGVTLFLTMNNQDASAPAVASHGAKDDARDRGVAVSSAAEAKPAAPAAQTVTPTVESVPSIATEGAAMGSAAAVAQAGNADVSTAVATAPAEPAKIAVAGKKLKPSKAVDKQEAKPEKPTSAVDAKGGAGAKKQAPTGGSKDGEMGGLDDLLKEAGVKNKPEPTKPTLDKKSLESSDIRKAMSAVAGKAQACYAGQQGTANVKLSVAPSGKVQKVTVTGVFAGTPVAACVEAAVKGASFPPWDGGPQSVSYSYLLSE